MYYSVKEHIMLDNLYSKFKGKDLTIKDFHELPFEEQQAWERLTRYIEEIFGSSSTWKDGYEKGYSAGYDNGYEDGDNLS